MLKWVVAMVAATLPSAVAAQARPDQQSFVALYKELVESDTTLSSGSCMRRSPAARPTART